MEGFFQQDSSFFQIISATVQDRDISKDVISFSFKEETGKMPEGSLVLADNVHYYSKVIVPFTTAQLTFGYKQRNVNATQLIMQAKNPTELIGGNVRAGLKIYLTNLTGNAQNNGAIQFNCNFMGEHYGSNFNTPKVWSKGIKASVIAEEMFSLGVKNLFMNFQQQNDILTLNRDVRKYESTFRFLLRMASEWRCIFLITHDSKGILSGLFVDQNKINDPYVVAFLNKCTSTIGSQRTLEFGYGSVNANVISYSWQNHAGDNGQGDNVQIQYINGEPVFTRYVAVGKKVTAYRLNETRIAEFVQKMDGNDAEVLKNVITSSSLESAVTDNVQVKYFFDKVESETAPQGMGYSMNVEMIGDPLLVPNMQVRFGNGFPEVFRNPANDIITKFYIKSVTHKIDSQGYRCSLVIGDTISVYGSLVR